MEREQAEGFTRRSGFGGGNASSMERQAEEDAAFNAEYRRGLKDQAERERESIRQGVRDASRERSRAACRVAAELGAQEWERRLWAAYHEAGDQPSKPPLPMAFMGHALSVLKDERAGADARAGAAVIAKTILSDLTLLAAAAGMDVKGEAKSALARLLGR